MNKFFDRLYRALGIMLLAGLVCRVGEEIIHDLNDGD